jgi:HK97 gp10 family phage protein
MITIEGLDNVLNAIEDIGDTNGVKQAMAKACLLVEAEARKKAPKDTGALRRSITSKVDADNGDIKGIVYTPLEYAPYVEYGTGLFAQDGGRKTPWRYKDDDGSFYTTVGQHPQPFLHPSLNENVDEIKKIIKGGLGK